MKQIRQLLLILLVQLTGFSLLAQQKEACAAYDDGTHHVQPFELLIRGKALGFVIIEDVWVRSFSIGTEVRFFEQFSFSCDLVHLRWKYEGEVYPDPINEPDKYDEYPKLNPRNYLALETRYYPLLLSFDQSKFYLNAYGKFGKQRVYIHDQYPLEDNEVFRSHGTFQDVGGAIGFQYGRRFGVDVSLGLGYRFEQRWELTHHDNGPDVFTDHIHDNRVFGNLRVNFYWNPFW